MGWRELRPLQEASIAPILDGSHGLLLAPTAGGKTEAAFLPVLSRMVTEEWSGLSVIYVCPLKALLNNLHSRLERYSQWVGRSCALWHGDVADAQRKAILKELPDCLLTTPESLEAMLVSTRVDHRRIFFNVRTIIVDEIHAFAGDDRGWHLLAVLERITRLSGREIQRVGLSATVGNPQGLLDWLAAHCEGKRQLVQIEATKGAAVPEVLVDYVGSLENAATVIASLHRGEKRLVFCDSRSKVEELATRLRNAGVETHVSHSSLSAKERQKAEQAFAEANNCVIVATSTLELGIDVGDLDRVIQIDAPSSVASFLQRIGRTGRRAGSTRNCLFLTTSEDAFLQATGIVKLWQKGFVEPITPPECPLHLLGQQLLALILQERSLPSGAWQSWLCRLPAFSAISPEERQEVTGYLITSGFIHVDQNQWMLGPQADEEYGFRHFSELVSVFTSPPIFEVWHGPSFIGSVEQSFFMAPPEKRVTLSLGGRAWKVLDVSWSKRRAMVQPEPGHARTRWLGEGRSLSFELCQMVRSFLIDSSEPNFLTRRGLERLALLRGEHSWLNDSKSGCLPDDHGSVVWWNFTGQCLNRWISELATAKKISISNINDFSIKVSGGLESVQKLQQLIIDGVMPTPDYKQLPNMKFNDLLPPHLGKKVCIARAYPEVEILRLRAKFAAPSKAQEAGG